MSSNVFNRKSFFERINDKMSTPQLVTITFFLVVFTGSILLRLPISHAPDVDVRYIDALFTATSAVCVTGLVTVVTASTWNLFGKIVIICLIQVGGLSLITIFFYFITYTKKKITLKNRLAIQAALNANDLKGLMRMVRLVAKGTAIVESTGAVILFFYFLHDGQDFMTALGWGIFHSVSGFCNAGFDVIGDSSLMPYSGSVVVNLTIMSLVILSGIGFSVWANVVDIFKSKVLKRIKQRPRLRLQSKIAIIATAILLVSGTVFVLLIEYNNPETIGNFSFGHKLLASAFQSTTLRTAGFATINQGGMHDATKFICSIYMLIGGSPGGTAGGFKTVTLAIVICAIITVAKGKESIVVMNRTISQSLLKRALAVMSLMMFLQIVVTTILSITESGSMFPHDFVDLFFETSSALGTVGLTTGITPYLSGIGKLLIISCMFMGRVGPITIMISLTTRKNTASENVHYPKEEIMIG